MPNKQREESSIKLRNSPKNKQNLREDPSKKKQIIIQILKFWIFQITGFVFFFFIIRNFCLYNFWDNSFSTEMINLQVEKYALDQNLWKQLLRSIWLIITKWDWGFSFEIAYNQQIWDVIRFYLPRSIEIFFIAFLMSLPIGIIMGYLRSAKTSKKMLKKRITIVSNILCGMLGILFPFFLLSILKTYLTPEIFPSGHYMTMFFKQTYTANYYFTGFGLIDTFFHFRFCIWLDILEHLLLPCFILSIPMIPLTMMVTIRVLSHFHHSKSKSQSKNILNGPLFTTLIGSLLLIWQITIEYTFNIYGVGIYFIDAFWNREKFFIQGFLMLFLFVFGGIAFFINMMKIVKQKTEEINPEELNPEEINPEDIKPTQKLQKKIKKLKIHTPYLRNWIKNGWTISGLIGFTFALICTILGLIKFDRIELTMSQQFAWTLPNSEHLLGQTYNGYDLLGRFLYGFQPVILLIIGTLISGIFGIIVGLLLPKKKNIMKSSITAILDGFLCIPIFIFIIFLEKLQSINILLGMVILNFFIAVRIGIHLAEEKNHNRGLMVHNQEITFKIVLYLIGLVFVFFNLNLCLSYLEFQNYDTISWGWDIGCSRSFIKNYPLNFVFQVGPILINLILFLFLQGTFSTLKKLKGNF